MSLRTTIVSHRDEASLRLTIGQRFTMVKSTSTPPTSHLPPQLLWRSHRCAGPGARGQQTPVLELQESQQAEQSDVRILS